jgi:hypothetical protein
MAPTDKGSDSTRRGTRNVVKLGMGVLVAGLLLCLLIWRLSSPREQAKGGADESRASGVALEAGGTEDRHFDSTADAVPHSIPVGTIPNNSSVETSHRRISQLCIAVVGINGLPCIPCEPGDVHATGSLGAVYLAQPESSNMENTFRFFDLPEDQYQLSVNDPAHEPWVGCDAGLNDPNIVAELRGNCSLSVRAVAASTHQPIAQFEVTLRATRTRTVRQNGTQYVETLQSNIWSSRRSGLAQTSDGAITIESLSYDDHDIEVSAAGFSKWTGDVPGLRAGEQKRIVCELVLQGTVVGRVCWPDGRPVAGVPIGLYKAEKGTPVLLSEQEYWGSSGFGSTGQREVAGVASDDDGNFEFRNVDPAEYVVCGALSPECEARQCVQVEPAAGVAVVLVLSAGIALDGKITDNGNKPRSLWGVAVTPSGAVSANRNMLPATAITNADGEFRIRGLRPGKHKIYALPLSSSRPYWQPMSVPEHTAKAPALVTYDAGQCSDVFCVYLGEWTSFDGTAAFVSDVSQFSPGSVRVQVPVSAEGEALPIACLAPVDNPACKIECKALSPDGEALFEAVIPGHYKVGLWEQPFATRLLVERDVLVQVGSEAGVTDMCPK